MSEIQEKKVKSDGSANGSGHIPDVVGTESVKKTQIGVQEIKMFTKFKGKVKENFREKMIEYWMKDEDMTREEALKCYGDSDFDELCERLEGTECTFNPDLGYWNNEKDGTTCFESVDNNFVIPVSLIDIRA